MDERAKDLEAAIASGVDAQDADILADKGEKQIIIAERERRIAAVRDAGRPCPEESADLQHKSAVIASPILALPHEITAEIFQWNTWRGGDLLILLLVCKQWTAVAYAYPRLWSRISLSNDRDLSLGSLHCGGLNQLRVFLSRSQSSPLQIRIGRASCSKTGTIALSSFCHKPLGPANRTEAINLILSDEILGRCTSVTFGHDPIPKNDPGHWAAVEAMTVLPLLSCIRITTLRLKKHELRMLQSLARCSPSLRHIRYDYWAMSPQELGAESWATKIETYGWVSASKLCHSLQESPSLRELRIQGDPVIPITLLAVQELRWMGLTFPGSPFGSPFIIAPQLHTLILNYAGSQPVAHPPDAWITLPTLRIAIHLRMLIIPVLRAFQTPALEHLSIHALSLHPTDLLDVFDGSGHMPTPKSLHLNCAFADTALIAVLGRLPQLEELRVAGGIPEEAFWEALTPPCNLGTWSYLLDAHANNILVPKLQILLVDNSQKYNTIVHRPDDDRKALLSKRGEWTVTQASAAAVARERAGCPLKTLACWSPERKVTVLIGELESLPRRPECVLFIALWCRRDFLMCHK